MLTLSVAFASGSSATIPHSHVRLPGGADCDTHAEIVNAFEATSDDELLRLLKGSLTCERGGMLPSEGTIERFLRLQDLIVSKSHPNAAVDRALTAAEVAQEFGHGPLVANMVGVSIEQIAAVTTEALLPELTTPQQRAARARMKALTRGPTPHLADELHSTRARGEETWELTPFTSWCVAAVEQTTQELQPLLELAPIERETALLAYGIAHQPSAITPWGRAGESCTFGISPIALDWHTARTEADAAWSGLVATGSSGLREWR